MRSRTYWHVRRSVAGMTGHLPFSVPCGPLKGVIMHTLIEIPIHSWHFSTCQTQVIRHFVQSLIYSPVSHVRRAFRLLPYLLSWVCHSALRQWLSFTLFEILHTLSTYHTISIDFTNWRRFSPASTYFVFRNCITAPTSCLEHCFSQPCVFKWRMPSRWCCIWHGVARRRIWKVPRTCPLVRHHLYGCYMLC